MKTNIKQLPKSQIEIDFEIPPEEMEKYLNQAAKECSHGVKIEGFRPGKSPRALVEKKVGKHHLWEEAAEIAVRKSYVGEILDKKIEAIGHPEITIKKLAPDNPFEFTAKVAIMPEIKISEYKNLGIKCQKVSIEKKEISDTLSWLQKSRAKYSDSSDPVQNGDLVDFNFESRIGGVKIENGEIKNQIEIIGENKLSPEFEKNLIDLKKDEEKEFTIKMPENNQQKNIAEKMVSFKVKINNIQKRELPEINDEFAKTLGNFENLATLEKNIADGLKFEKEKKEKERWRMELIKKIADSSKLNLPEILIEREIERMINELEHSIEHSGLKMKDYLIQIKKTEDDLKKDFQKDAEERVKIALTLREISKLEKIEPSREEIEIRANEYLKQYHSPEEAEKNIDPQELFEYAKGILKNEKVFEFLEEVN